MNSPRTSPSNRKYREGWDEIFGRGGNREGDKVGMDDLAMPSDPIVKADCLPGAAGGIKDGDADR